MHQLCQHVQLCLRPMLDLHRPPSPCVKLCMFLCLCVVLVTAQVPFPGMHFLLSSLAPLAAPRDVAALTAPRSIDQVRSGDSIWGVQGSGFVWMHRFA